MALACEKSSLRNHVMYKRNGFTLIELLVVISVIALLMMILMPALQRARRQARAVVCQSQLHQWALVFSAYTGDHNGYFMQGWTGTEEHPYEQGRWIWINALRPYYGGPKTRLCPMATKFIVDENGTNTGARPPYAAYGIINRGDTYKYINGDFTSYTINWWVNRCPPRFNQERLFWRDTNVRLARNIPVLVDGNFWLARPKHTDEPPEFDGQWSWTDAPGQMGMKRVCVNRHNGFTNGLFMDWSIRKMGLKEVYKFKWNRRFDTTMTPVWPAWMKGLKDYY